MDSKAGVEYVEVFDQDIFYATGCLAPDGKSGERGGARYPADGDAGARAAKGDAVFVPAALY